MSSPAVADGALAVALAEALEQQRATSEILKAIPLSTADIQPVFDTIAVNAGRLCSAEFCHVFRFDGRLLHFVAYHRLESEGVEAVKRVFPSPPGSDTAAGRSILSRSIEQIPDVDEDRDYGPFATITGGYRSLIGVPMMREGVPVGSIVVARSQTGLFPERQVELLRTFADQAVIAIENARLLEELTQRNKDLSVALEQQIASSEILRAIAASPNDSDPVLKAVAESAARLCGAIDATILLQEADVLAVAAHHGEIPIDVPSFPITRGIVSGRALLDGVPVHVHDLTDAGDEFPLGQAYALRYGFRSILSAPLLREGKAIGAIMIRRAEVRPFSTTEIELLKTFADQAVIAIQNARLFEEVRARTLELQEALDYQTATSEVLSVISRSPSQAQPVLDTIVATASHLCQADYAFVFMRKEDSKYHLQAGHLADPAYLSFMRANPITLGRGTTTGRAALERRTIHIPDATADPDYAWGEWIELSGSRTFLSVPLLRDGDPVGVISAARKRTEPFSQRQIDLITTFADQAVIAIENARLFDEVRAKTGDLTEALEQQTATADILGVISNSLSDTQPVFDAIVRGGVRLFSGAAVSIALAEGDRIEVKAVAEEDADRADAWRSVFPFPLAREYMHGAAILDNAVVDIPDVRLAPPQFDVGGRNFLKSGYRAVTIMPLVRAEQGAIGALSVVRRSPGPVSAKQLEILRTFARQAVIAIENTRLLRELRETLQQQTATAEVLKAISRSAFDLEAVLQTLVESAAQLCDADKATITRQIQGIFYRAEAYGFSQEFIDYVRSIPVEPEPGSVTGRALLEGHVIHIADVEADPDYTFLDARKLGGFRTILGVPMLREGVPIGVFALTRDEVRPFSEKQIELVSTFADQAAIAIENARLFEEVRERTRELSRSLEELRAAQDRLVQTEKLASLGQLTAGIAHEIKNPLNFVNNFAALSTELLEELRAALAAAGLGEAAGAEAEQLVQMLEGNLGRIVEHGRRADSIVKNMLLHSRSGSGERRPVDVNALVEESLNLAYHGARAERPGFNIRLEKSLDPAAGEADVHPQEITRVLLNIISNGFYAASKRKEADDGGGFEPSLCAATRDLGDRIEIRIRDNGAGVPAEVRERMFDPFFTTKPAGEGTGLGLSLSHDIVVKQHMGSIEVDSEPGAFTEFRIVLPRGGPLDNSGGGGRDAAHPGR